MIEGAGKTGWVAGLTMAALLGIGFAPSAMASGQRLVVSVPEPFEVDGKLFPAGVLAVRHLRDYNPSTSLDEVTAGTTRLGMMMALRQRSESPMTGDSVVFARNSDGRLTLLGYYLAGSSKGQLYVYRTSRSHSPVVAGNSTVLLACAGRPLSER